MAFETRQNFLKSGDHFYLSKKKIGIKQKTVRAIFLVLFITKLYRKIAFLTLMEFN